MKTDKRHRIKEDLEQTVDELRQQLAEANDVIDAIRTGQIDALMVQAGDTHQLYTLKSADHVYRIFVEKMTEGAVTLNREGVIVFCNSRFANMVHVSLSGVLGMPFEQFIANESKRIYQDYFDKSWKGHCRVETLLVSGEEYKPVQLAFNTLELEGGIALSVILTDLSAQKMHQRQLQLSNQQLEQANHALEISNHDLQQFASVASHDLQEPLRKIQIFSALVQGYRKELPVVVNSYVDKIIHSTTRMRALIIDILNYSRLSADVPWEELQLNTIFEEVLEDFELIIQEKGATVTIGEMPSVEVNKGQIRQVLHNIISNALKFSRYGVPPKVLIRSTLIRDLSFESPEDEEGTFCLISIRDNGIGFNEKYVENVFALFERLHSKDKFEGTGIGMAIAKRIIDKHAGIIGVVSQEGKGSEFRFVIPLKQRRYA